MNKIVKPSKDFKNKCVIYKLFLDNKNKYDLSDKALNDLYIFETFGKGDIKIGGFNQTTNGYAVGKRWCDIQVASWLEDCEVFPKNTRVLFSTNPEYDVEGKIKPKKLYTGWYNVIREVYNDPKFKKHWWWLDRIFKKFLDKKSKYYLENNMEDDVKELIKTIKQKVEN